MKAIALIGIGLLVSGCTAFGVGGPAHLSPEQIQAASKVKDANMWCFAGTYAGARVNTLAINTDKGVPVGVQIDAECKASFLSQPNAPRPE